MNQERLTKILFTTGSSLVIISAIAKLVNFSYAPHVFTFGVVLLIYVQLKNVIDNRKAETRQKRLSRNGMVTSLLLALAAYFMFTGSNSWVVLVLIYALSTFFLTFRGDKK
jgi:hypothetical protein